MSLDVLGHEDVAGDKSRGDAELAQRLDHKQRIVPTSSRARLQCVERVLGAELMTLAIFELLADAMRHAAQDLECWCRRVLVEKAARPFPDMALGIGILRRGVLHKVGKFLVVVDERVEIGGIIRRERKLLDRIVLDGDVPIECQRVRAFVEIGDRDRVTEHVVNPVQRHRHRRDLEPEVRARADRARRADGA